ncbi:MAG: divergent polysaccharide deacetylase family protein [Desulfobacterales bacterium]
MASKKPAKKKNLPKKTKKRSGKKNNLKIQLVKICAGLCLLLALVAVSGFAVHHLLLRKEKTRVVVYEKIKPTADTKQKVDASIGKHESVSGKNVSAPETGIRTAKIPEFKKSEIYEVFPEKDFVEPKPSKKPTSTGPLKKRPKVAIIIDDLGYDPYLAKRFVELDHNLTFSLIPYSPFQKKVAELVRQKGGELMLHIPMEPKEYPRIDPGPGALLSTMEPDQLIAQLNKNLDTISDAKGVNGHMGSKLTANSEQMYQIFTVLKQRNLYFIDSLTTAESVCKPSAKLLKIPFAQRDVFIDHVQEKDFIRTQINHLIKRAKNHGEAIGIAHPHKETIEILEKLLPELKQQVDLVPASQLVRKSQ